MHTTYPCLFAAWPPASSILVYHTKTKINNFLGVCAFGMALPVCLRNSCRVDMEQTFIKIHLFQVFNYVFLSRTTLCFAV